MNRFWLVSYGYQDTWLNTMHKSGLAFSTEYWGDFQSRNNLLSRFFLPPLQWAVDKGLNGRNRIVFMTSVSARKITKAQRILLLVFFFSFFPLFAWRDELLVCGGSTFPLVYSKVRMWHWLLAVRTRSTKFKLKKPTSYLIHRGAQFRKKLPGKMWVRGIWSAQKVIICVFPPHHINMQKLTMVS